ncbi:hypothetical protein LCGC14_0658560 [marine sediment metagenome]|uniref:Uncharacterized protein n=1 Tax=marine sediment metagenome TaxID=412755 RepID=A0A0F9U2M4_9ZZZZ|nr:hypothetical protein [archaeon]
MGQFGFKTYESDYIEDLLIDYGLIKDFRKGGPLTIDEVRKILNSEENKEVYLGIVSFLIDEWESPDELIPVVCLEAALKYAEGLLSNYSYASSWLDDWNYRIEELEEEIKAIVKILNPSVIFDFSKYETVNQDSFFDLNNWEKFNENDKFSLINFLSINPNRKTINILKKEISKYRGKSEGDATSRLVLAALALSQLEGEDAIDIILENSYDLIDSLIEERVEEYLKIRLRHTTNSQLRKKIEEKIEDLHQEETNINPSFK